MTKHIRPIHHPSPIFVCPLFLARISTTIIKGFHSFFVIFASTTGQTKLAPKPRQSQTKSALINSRLEASE
ncbi:unnamed protein product [Cuscuta campestris]|uniref:Uncharacterized protein n=1 Tax=Cuscuta campestris TaxID=132261 RepID=A0A484LCC8_9ASTE|nr:unnamed protein product [Cuscuta campestris]